jgi:hypothetical protein
VALVWAGWWTIFGLVGGIGEGLDAAGVAMHTAVPGLLFLLAAVIAWRWELPGAVLLAVAGIATVSVYGFARTPEGFLLLTLPPLLAAGLFLMSWLNTGRAKASHGSA